MKKVLFTIVLMLLPMLANATIEANGIYYNLNNETMTAEVKGITRDYQGDVFIPDVINYNESPYRVVSIGESAFASRDGLKSISIPDGVISIGNYAFSGCMGLTSITIPKGVISIGDGAFVGSGITSIKVDDANTSYKSVSGILMSKNGTTLVAYPSGKRERSYTIPKGVTTIGNCAFQACSFLGSIDIHNGVKTIGDKAFRNCGFLNCVTIGSGVKTIGNEAFYQCYTLDDVTCHSKVVPNTARNAFDESGIASAKLHVPAGSVKAYKAAEPWNQFAEIDAIAVEVKVIYYIIDSEAKTAKLTESPEKYQGDVVIPGTIDYDEETYNVTTIGNSAFANCSGLTSVNIPEGVTSIDDFAFYGCSGLTSIDIPNSVTSIGSLAFYGCSGLTSITIGSGLTSIGDGAFDGCSGLTSFTVDGSNPNYKSEDGVLMSKDETTLIAYPAGKAETSYTIPNCVTTIGSSAFSSCSSLNSVEIPNSVTTIGSSAFSSCSSLNSVEIPNSVTTIGSSAFYSCSSLNSINIPDDVTSIDGWSFSGCINLTSITIPDGVTSIGNGAFDGCSGLTSITLGSGINSISSWAFRGCSGLTDMFCHAENVPKTNSNTFDRSNIANATLHVPAGSVDAYKDVEPWNGFKEFVALEGGEPEKGDLNGDNVVDAKDVAEIVDMIVDGGSSAASDMNGDGKVDIADVIVLVKTIIGE